MAYIDYSSDSNSTKSNKNILEDDNNEFEISLAELGRSNIGTLTVSTLKSHEKQYHDQEQIPFPLPSFSMETPAEPITAKKEAFSIEHQIAENNNMALVYGFAENLEILRSMNEEICERLDWVTQQTQQITDQFNEDREEARRERRRDRILGMGFSILETTLFIVGIIYATILFLFEMYYSVNFDFI
jgi:hypothetical protein